MQEHSYDVVVAGGGAASLSAALVLGRARRRIAVIDAGAPRKQWGRDLLHCPYCHGWEVRDQPLGVLGTQPGSLQHALLVRQWSDDVVFFVHTYDLTSTERHQLRARGVRVVDGEVVRLVVEDDRLRGVELADGQVIERTAVFIRPGNTPYDDGLLAGLGCELDGAGFPVVDAAGQTSVPGVWAAGNVADPRAQVVTAAGAGSAAAIAINADLVQEDAERAVDDLDTGGGAFCAAMDARVADLMHGDRRHVL
jgi:thioredoxin reductase